MIVLLWAVLGPVFGYSDTWQLVINTGTTIVTFLMVFLIQNTQNRDSEAMHIKLDEIICALDGANKALLNLEDLDEGELDEIRERYLSAAKQAHKRSEEHTSELQSLMRISYAVFCLKKKKITKITHYSTR